MVNRLQSWVFISLSMLLMGFALLPIIRVIVGVDDEFGMQFFTVVMLLIAGLMCGLTGMLLLARKQSDLTQYQSQAEDLKTAAKMHACGFLIFTGIPLLNFLMCYFLWVNNRRRSAYLDYQGREAICFQISIYLYLLLSLFMVFAVIGTITTPLLILFHLVVTIVAVVMASQGKAFRYPANITIIARTPNTQNTGNKKADAFSGIDLVEKND